MVVLARLCLHHFDRPNSNTLKIVRHLRLLAAPLGADGIQFDPANHY